MKSNQRGAAWPYLIILLGLFALSITAPRAWDRQRYAGPPLADVLADRPAATSAGETSVTETLSPKASTESKDVCPFWTSKPGQPFQHPQPAERKDVSAPAPAEPPAVPVAKTQSPNDANWIFSGTQLGPVVVKPLREFSRQVIDPIVELARKPTELRTLPDMQIPKFDSHDGPQVMEPVSVWVLPETLLGKLDRLAAHDETAAWANHVSALVRELYERGGNSRPTAAILGDLRDATDDVALPPVRVDVAKIELLRTRYAVVRRLEIWERIAQLGELDLDGATALPTPDERASDQRVLACLNDIERATATVSARDAWREYLLVDQLRTLGKSAENPRHEKREVAKLILSRLSAQQLSAKQRQFVAKTPIAVLSDELRPWAAEPVAMSRLLAHLEAFERTQLASDAQALANDCRSLRWVASDSAQQLGEQIDLHYRNANLRISLSSAFVNRFVPQPSAMQAAVRDTIAGVPVRGRSTTFTKVTLRMIPDPRRVRLGLEASGVVSSDTTSEAGPATFYNKAESSFLVRKLVLFGPNGLKMWPAVAEANSYYHDLKDLETNFDGVPLVGSLVRNIARSQHDETQVVAKGEVETKVAARARNQFDTEVQPRLDKMASDLDKQLLEPLRRLGLEPTALDMGTSEDRLQMRVRLAGQEQLAAHTPRPRATSDSLASIQVHQSALNNLLEQLDLNGREFAIPELYQWIGRKLNYPDLKQPEDVPEDIVVKFADQDALRLRCGEGHVELSVAIAKLTHGKKKWRDFVVKSTYKPDASTIEGRFVREGSIFLEGKSVQGKAEFVLRSIMSKALSVDRPWRIMPEKIATDPRIADIEVCQFVVEDGWVALAYAPRRVPSEMARKPRDRVAK